MEIVTLVRHDRPRVRCMSGAMAIAASLAALVETTRAQVGRELITRISMATERLSVIT